MYTVIDELDQAPTPKREQMLSLIGEFAIDILPDSPDADRLADIYIAEGIIPQKYVIDGMHIAMATVYDLDFIASYNFKHIVKRKTVTMTEVVNLREGYGRVGIFSPTEVIENVE